MFDLFVIDGHDDAAEIARTLLAEGTMQARSLKSAIRLVQSDLVLFREAGEHRRYVERRLWAMRRFRSIADDDTMLEFQVVTPKGEVVTQERPKWPANVRARAVAYFTEEAEAIARCSFVDVTGKKRGANPETNEKPRFRGSVPIDLSEMEPDERNAIAEAMQRFPGSVDDDSGDAPN